MLYVAIVDNHELKKYDKYTTAFIFGYNGLIKNAIFNMRNIMQKKINNGVYVYDVTEKSFKTKGRT